MSELFIYNAFFSGRFRSKCRESNTPFSGDFHDLLGDALKAAKRFIEENILENLLSLLSDATTLKFFFQFICLLIKPKCSFTIGKKRI